MFITYNHAQLFAVAFGGGSRHLLAMGGWAGSWELWVDPFMHLSGAWRTAAYDHRGVGATVCPTDSITLDALTDDVFAVMDALHVESGVLAAESAGAAIALRAALQQPERIRGLVLVDGMTYREASTAPDMFRMGLQHQFPQTMARFVEMCLPDPQYEAERRWGHQILARCTQPDALRLYDLMDGLNLHAQAAQIQQPTLLIHSTGDQIVPADDSRTLAALLPNARLHLIEGSGHVPTLTHGAEIAHAIEAFFGEK